MSDQIIDMYHALGFIEHNLITRESYSYTGVDEALECLNHIIILQRAGFYLEEAFKMQRYPTQIQNYIRRWSLRLSNFEEYEPLIYLVEQLENIKEISTLARVLESAVDSMFISS